MNIKASLSTFLGLTITTMYSYGAPPVSAQLKDPKAADVTVVGHILEPKKTKAKDIIPRIALPKGFEINVFAKDLINPRMIAVAADGSVFVTRREVGDVLRLVDADNDGVAEQQEIVANRPGMHGIAIDGNSVYLATVNDLYKTTIQPDGKFGPLDHFVDDLPDGGQHPNRTLAVGPDGKLMFQWVQRVMRAMRRIRKVQPCCK